MMAQGSEGVPFRLNKTYVTIAAIALSIIILVIITSVGGVNPTVIFTVVPIFLLCAIAATLLKLLFQGVRFNYILRAFSDRSYPFFESLIARFGSEFVALTSPAYVGGEVARAAWMTKRGEASGKALWLPYIEIVFDVYSGNLIALAAGIYALSAGDAFLGAVVMAVAVVILSLVTAVVLFSRRGGILIPSYAMVPLGRVVGRHRAESLKEKGDQFLEEFCEAANHTFTRKYAGDLLLVGLFTAAIVLLSTATLWFIAMGLNLPVSFIDSALLVYASMALGNLPITLGGSGVAEASVYLYAADVVGVSSWPMVFAWRILSYQMLLIITGICAFAILRRYTKSQPEKPLRDVHNSV